MSRSKAATQRYQLALQQQEQARTAAQQAAPMVRESIDRAIALRSLVTADNPSLTAANDWNVRMLEDKGFQQSLPDWLFETCPDWYIIAVPVKDDQTGKVISYDVKRDVEAWDRARVKALRAIQRMEFTWRNRPDGSPLRYVAEPCNMARLLSFVQAGNMAAVIEHSASVMSDARVTGNKGAGFTYYQSGRAMSIAPSEYKIILAASDLAAAQKRHDKAQQEAYVKLTDDKAQKRYDRAKVALREAQRIFDNAWSAVHRLDDDVIKLMDGGTVEDDQPADQPATASKGKGKGKTQPAESVASDAPVVEGVTA